MPGPSFTITSSSGQILYKYVKDTKEFLRKALADGITLCIMDVVGLYPKIPHEEVLSKKTTRNPKTKYVSNDTIIDLAEVVLKNNIFTFGKKILK